MRMLRKLLGLLRGELHVDRIKAKEAEVQKLKAGEHTVDIENTYIHISGETPYVRFEGTETGAADKGIKEDSGTLKIYDFASASNVMDLEAHASRHVEGGADPISGLTASQLAANTILFKIPVLIPDSPQTGLAADSTGTKWTSNFKFRIPKQNVKDVVIRATWTASHTDSTTEIALIDDAAGNTVCSVSGNAGTDAESTNYTEANLTDDGLVYAQASVTTASATTGATFDITYVAVEIKVAVS